MQISISSKSYIKIFEKKFLLIVSICFLISCTKRFYISKSDLDDSHRNDSIRKDIFKHEVSKLNLVDGDTLVDIGSQEGFHDFQLFHFYPNKFFILEDVTKKFNKRLRNPYITINGQKKYFRNSSLNIKGSDEKIPLNSGAYKTILCRRSLHEFKYPSKMLNEIKRVMSQDGVLIIEELIPKVKDEVDIGCKMKHLTKDQIVDLLSKNGLFLIASDTSTWTLADPKYYNFNILKFKK